VHALAPGGHGLDRVDDLGAVDDAAEHGVAPALRRLAAKVEEVVVDGVDEELRVAECGSPVRAIASVWRLFFRPLPASLRIGASVPLCFMPGSKPPPCTMKPLMTR